MITQISLYCAETDSSLDWVVRHGRAVALSIAIKEAADKIINEEFTKAVYDSTLTNATADRVSQFIRKEYTWCKVEKYATRKHSSRTRTARSSNIPGQ